VAGRLKSYEDFMGLSRGFSPVLTSRIGLSCKLIRGLWSI
jgi:hypothetical protein